jgi:excisionase family DNA binding protein
MLAATRALYWDEVCAEVRALGCDHAEAEQVAEAFFASLLEPDPSPPVTREDRARVMLLAAMGELPAGGYRELGRQLGVAEEVAWEQVQRLRQDCRQALQDIETPVARPGRDPVCAPVSRDDPPAGAPAISATVPPPSGRETLTMNQACERVGVSRRTIYNWIESGKIATVRTAGGCLRIFADTLYQPTEPKA